MSTNTVIQPLPPLRVHGQTFVVEIDGSSRIFVNPYCVQDSALLAKMQKEGTLKSRDQAEIRRTIDISRLPINDPQSHLILPNLALAGVLSKEAVVHIITNLGDSLGVKVTVEPRDHEKSNQPVSDPAVSEVVDIELPSPPAGMQPPFSSLDGIL